MKALEALGWGPGRPRVLVSDGWFANAGDAAIAVSIDRVIRRAAPEAEIVHTPYHASPIGDRLGLTLAPPLDALIGARFAPSCEGIDLGAGSDFVTGADLVVSQGGGFLLEHYRPFSRIEALATVAELGLPLAFVAQTIGHFVDATARRRLALALRSAVLVGLRDRGSVGNVIDLGVNPRRIMVGSDLALLLVDAAVEEERRGVGVVLTDTLADPGHDPLARRELAFTVLRDVLSLTDEPVTLFSSAQGSVDPAVEDDLALERLAIRGLESDTRRRVEIIETEVDVAELLRLASSLRAVVSMRLHPSLLALASGTPSALLLDAFKTGCLEGADVPRCTRPQDQTCRRHAIRRALDGSGPTGEELRALLAEPLKRAQVLGGALGDLVRSVTPTALK